MRVKQKTLIEVGIFVALGLGIALVSVFFIGQGRSFFSRTYTIIASFNEVSGLRKGAVVQLSGLNVGYVDGVRLPQNKEGKNLDVVLKIMERYKEYIRRDSLATMQTQGLLGDKFILVTRGSPSQPALANGESIETQGGADLTGKGKEMLSAMTDAAKKFRETMDKLSLDETDKEAVKKILSNMEGASGDLKSILNRVNQGEGTIGALLKDPALYNDMRALMGRANRSKLLKNLIRSTISEEEKGTKKPLE